LAVGVAAKWGKRSGVVKQGIYVWVSVPLILITLQNFWCENCYHKKELISPNSKAVQSSQLSSSRSILILFSCYFFGLLSGRFARCFQSKFL